MTKDFRMFVDDTFTDRDRCEVCRWQLTRMCPKSYEYVGRFMGDPETIGSRRICHRFVPTETESLCRQEIVYNKLHENLEFED